MTDKYSSVAAIIVLYFPDANLLENNLSKLIDLGCKVVFYDNTNDLDIVENNKKIINAIYPSCNILGGYGNDGLSQAFNQVINEEWDNVDAFFFLDQDSIVNIDVLSALFDDFFFYHKKHNIAIMGGIPIKKNGNIYRTKRLKGKPICDNISEVYSVPSSFSLISKDAIEKVGLFQSDFFIDYIDIDMSIRCRINGMKVVVNERCLFVHDIGEGSITFLGYHLTPISSPHRHYFQIRNALLSFKRNKIGMVKIIVLVLKRLLTVSLNSVVDVKSFHKRFYYYALGIYHALIDKAGKL